MALKIFFSNLGYARGIDGSLMSHIQGVYKHIYCSPFAQEQTLAQLNNIIKQYRPDLCCFVEIEQGTSQIRRLNHLHYLLNDDYPYYDIANKYGDEGVLRYLPLHIGRSNGFMGRNITHYEKMYFRHGSKRLIYKIELPQKIDVLFTHFSLNYKTRQKQLAEMAQHILTNPHQVILLADFNILTGFAELGQFIEQTGLTLLNDEETATFRFHRKYLPLDLAMASPALSPHVSLHIIDQPFSDHDALFLTVDL